MKSFTRYFALGFIFLLMSVTGISQSLTDSTSIKYTPIESDAEYTDFLPIANGYDWITYRGKADITDTGGTRSCNFYVVNRTDSIVYINIHSMGIEIARAVFTTDSITYVNKLTYQYYKDSYTPINRILPFKFDFSLIQAIVNGDLQKLPKGKKFSFEYLSFEPVSDTSCFFTEFILKDLDRVLEIHGNIKLIRFNKPAYTAIKIPEKFEKISLQ